MAYELKQELKLSQKLLLTPQLQLAIKLLQLSRLELIDTVMEELLQNPVLEENGGMSVEEQPVSQTPEAHEMDWQEYLGGEDGLRGLKGSAGLDFSKNDDDDFYEKAGESGTSLKEHLLWQLHSVQSISDKLTKVCEFIIGNIDEHGFLKILDDSGGGVADNNNGQLSSSLTPGSHAGRDGADEDPVRRATVDEIARLIGVGTQEVHFAVELVQGFDPSGICATSTRECLYLQAKRLPERDALVEEIVLNYLPLLARRDFDAISKKLGDVGAERVASAALIITERLSPMPGSGFGTDQARAVVPDVFIKKVDNEYVVVLNDNGLPRLSISPYYKEMLNRNNGDGFNPDARGYVQERFKSAMWLIKSVHQRQRTLRKVVESIVRVQGEFFDRGLEYLRPLVLKDVAVDIDMHESTVSRVTTNKYVETPRGIFELKYFFTTGMSTDDGNSTTAEFIKEKISLLIAAEDVHRPLSDQQIVAKLKELGIALARRTVAKYREEIGFQSSSRRKRLY